MLSLFRKIILEKPGARLLKEITYPWMPRTTVIILILFIFSFSIKYNMNTMATTGNCTNTVLIWTTLSARQKNDEKYKW